MSLLSLPVEVNETFILPLLGWNDLLRLRRTCKAARNLVQNYVRRYPELAPELEINEKEKNIRNFLKLGIPTTKLFLNNVTSGNQFYARAPATAARFLQEYGSLVTHLRVAKFSTRCTVKATRLLEGFVNLTSFAAEQTVMWSAQSVVLPCVFNQLLELKLQRGSPREVDAEDNFDEVLGNFLRHCRILEHFRFPYCNSEYDYVGLLPASFEFLAAVITERINSNGNLSPLKVLDCGELPPCRFSDVNAQGFFLDLCQVCWDNNVRIDNVHESWIDLSLINNLPREMRLQAMSPVVSLTSSGFPMCVYLTNMPNLEQLRIGFTIGISGAGGQEERPRCNLPKLKNFDITMSFSAVSVFQYFFQGVRHENLEELSVCVLSCRGNQLDTGSVVAGYLLDTCPNLKRLKLANLSGYCVRLAELWGRLTKLEELELTSCGQIGIEAFVGGNDEHPAFMNMTKLKKLSLNELYRMPGITDRVFTQVIRRLSLTHLTLASFFPVQTVTVRGIQSLIDGPFGHSIEKFPFQDWSLSQVTEEEFKALGGRFRCNEMM